MTGLTAEESDERTIKRRDSLRDIKMYRHHVQFTDFNEKLLTQVEKKDDVIKDLREANQDFQDEVLALEEENLTLKDNLHKSNSDLKNTKLELEDLKKRVANYGMIEVLEIDLARQKELVKEVESRLSEKQSDYSQKLQNWKEQLEQQREKISELEEYKLKYEELTEGQQGEKFNYELKKDIDE